VFFAVRWDTVITPDYKPVLKGSVIRPIQVEVRAPYPRTSVKKTNMGAFVQGSNTGHMYQEHTLIDGFIVSNKMVQNLIECFVLSRAGESVDSFMCFIQSDTNITSLDCYLLGGPSLNVIDSTPCWVVSAESVRDSVGAFTFGIGNDIAVINALVTACGVEKTTCNAYISSFSGTSEKYTQAFVRGT